MYNDEPDPPHQHNHVFSHSDERCSYFVCECGDVMAVCDDDPTPEDE